MAERRHQAWGLGGAVAELQATLVTGSHMNLSLLEP